MNSLVLTIHINWRYVHWSEFQRHYKEYRTKDKYQGIRFVNRLYTRNFKLSGKLNSNKQKEMSILK